MKSLGCLSLILTRIFGLGAFLPISGMIFVMRLPRSASDKGDPPKPHAAGCWCALLP